MMNSLTQGYHDIIIYSGLDKSRIKTLQNIHYDGMKYIGFSKDRTKMK